MHLAIYICQDKFDGAMTPSKLVPGSSKNAHIGSRYRENDRIEFELANFLECVAHTHILLCIITYITPNPNQSQMPNVKKSHETNLKRKENDNTKIR